MSLLMKIQLHEITVRELVAGYRDDGEGGKSESKRMNLRTPGA